jgi:hypothetical protein
MAASEDQGANVNVIALRQMEDAAPLPHLRHVSRSWREYIVKVGGTPEGFKIAKEVQQWAGQAIARAIASEASAHQIAQQYGTGSGRDELSRSFAARQRKLAAALEQEAEALRTTHEQATPFMGDAASLQTYRRRLEQHGV